MTFAATTFPSLVIINLDDVRRDAFARMWDDLGHLAGEEMPSEHVIGPYFFGFQRSTTEIACQCFPCRAWQAYKDATRVIPKVGRNEMCLCGSGRKYKKCHGQ